MRATTQAHRRCLRAQAPWQGSRGSISIAGSSGGYQNLFPDYYTAVNGSTCVQLYNTASRCAILHFSGAYRVFSLGFPLEIVVGAANRASLMEKMLVNFE
jgi:hypothetical protein